MRFKRLISLISLIGLIGLISIPSPSYSGQIFDPTGGKDNPVFTGVSSFPNGTQAAPSGIFTGITDRGFFNDTANNRFGIAEGLSLPGGQLVLTALSTPGTPTVTPRGTTGATSYGYKITATNGSGVTAAGTEGTTATGNATLSATNYNELAWTAVTGATGYKVYRTTGGATQGLISTITSGSTVTVNDTGLAGGGETPETANTTGRILTADGVAVNPAWSFGSDPDTGPYLSAANEYSIATAGTQRIIVDSSGIAGALAAAPLVRNANASSTNATLIPDKRSTSTGIGANNAGTDLSLISSGVETIRVTTTGSLYTPVLQANLGTPSNGTFIYCSDCTIANPCAGGGSGALAKRLNATWVCN